MGEQIFDPRTIQNLNILTQIPVLSKGAYVFPDLFWGHVARISEPARDRAPNLIPCAHPATFDLSIKHSFGYIVDFF